MIGDFNIRGNNQDLLYPYYSVYTDILIKIANSFDLRLSISIIQVLTQVISQTLKHVQNIFNFNTSLNPHGYLALFVPKTPSVVWYFIIDLILSNLHSYLALIESKSVVIFICFYCLIISFKLHKFTWTLYYMEFSLFQV